MMAMGLRLLGVFIFVWRQSFRPNSSYFIATKPFRKTHFPFRESQFRMIIMIRRLFDAIPVVVKPTKVLRGV